MGILIAIDGVDASGKETQSKLIAKRLEEAGKAVRVVSFPAYDSKSSELVKMYLSGSIGKNANDVNAYAASTFFAADRYITYKTDWGKDYDNGVIIIADRYIPANMIHQACKLETDAEKDEFSSWVYDLEYEKYGLPKPSATVFLDMPVETGMKLMAERSNKIDGSDNKDIHERDSEHLRKSYDTAIFMAKKFGWRHIKCAENGQPRGIEEINDEIYEIIKEIMT